jgi:hypothetical protein
MDKEREAFEKWYGGAIDGESPRTIRKRANQCIMN